MSGSPSSKSSSPQVAELPSRAALRNARRVCVKAGTSVVAKTDGRPSLTRLGSIVEQVSELVERGVQVILVSSGSVGMGKRLLRKHRNMMMSLKDISTNGQIPVDDGVGIGAIAEEGAADLAGQSIDDAASSSFIRQSASFVSLLMLNERPHTLAEKKKHYDSACAAAGQFEMMNLYNALFQQCDVSASQLLVTQADFEDPKRLTNLKYSVDRLLGLGIVPIINENDAVSANLGYTADHIFSDNDSLAALVSRSLDCEVLLLLTDVSGVYDRPPSEDGAKLLSVYEPDRTEVAIGEKSAQGRGGMGSKIDAALAAVRDGSRCTAAVVAAGNDLNCVRAVLGRPNPSFAEPRGTLFCRPGSDLERQAVKEWREAQERETEKSDADGGTTVSQEARDKATAARREARKLQALPHSVRREILSAMADSLLARQEELLEANATDVEQAERDGIAAVLRKRLKLTPDKLEVLAAGLRQLAAAADCLGVVQSKRELSEGLELQQVTTAIGVLLVIFESRPDSMPQISALALASGNGLLLKGGKEAAASNAAIHTVLGDAIEAGSGGRISREIVGLVAHRGQVADMLVLDDVIDLVIPRGSNALVSHIQKNTRIPVLGHADGVCHVYVDRSAKAEDAARIAVDAKTDYPSACNAMETLLLHRDTVASGVAAETLMALRASGVKCLGGPAAMKLGLTDHTAEHRKFEYGDLTCQVEVVESMDEAIDWIHANGSGHTEAIVCGSGDDEDSKKVGEEFLRRVDAACVFCNSSTRFADGFRFGLGAEVGISTGRIHARGPVGVQGLLTTKWQLRSTAGETYAVRDFAGDQPNRTYTHKELPCT